MPSIVSRSAPIAPAHQAQTTSRSSSAAFKPSDASVRTSTERDGINGAPLKSGSKPDWDSPRVQEALALMEKVKQTFAASRFELECDEDGEEDEYQRFLNLVIGYGKNMLTSSDLDHALRWTFRNHPDLLEAWQAHREGTYP